MLHISVVWWLQNCCPQGDHKRGDYHLGSPEGPLVPSEVARPEGSSSQNTSLLESLVLSAELPADEDSSRPGPAWLRGPFVPLGLPSAAAEDLEVPAAEDCCCTHSGCPQRQHNPAALPGDEGCGHQDPDCCEEVSWQ